MLIELIALILVRKYSGLKSRALEFIVTLCAGAALLLSLRCALRGYPWERVSFWLLIALVFHAWDLTLRWSDRRTRSRSA